MLSTSKLGKSFGGRTLFEDVSLQCNPGSRYGLVGANGSGKTTFLKIVAGDEPATEGSVSIPGRARVGVLRQDRFLDDDAIILDLAMMGDAPVWDALSEQRAHRRSTATATPARLAELEDVLRAHDGYTLEARASAVLEGLGIPIASHRQPLATLSGGFKLRVLLAQVLLGGPDVLLLDEPTNHLDILSIRWLEKFLAGYQGCALVISHDQRFLDNVATHILDVDYEHHHALHRQLRRVRASRSRPSRERKEAEIARAEKIIAEKRAFVERFGAKATKARQAQSRLKQIEKIEVEELADDARAARRCSASRPSGRAARDVLEVDGVSKAYGDKQVLARRLAHRCGAARRSRSSARTASANRRCSRSSMGDLDADAGDGEVGPRDARRLLRAGPPRAARRRADDAARLHLGRACPTEATALRARAARARALLGRRREEDGRRALGRRGGAPRLLPHHGREAERARARRADQPPRPRGDRRARRGAQGLRGHAALRLARSLVRLRSWRRASSRSRPSGSRDFPGTYAEYLERCGDDHLDADAVVLKAKKRERARAGGDAAATRRLSWEEQKRRRNRLKELPGAARQGARRHRGGRGAQGGHPRLYAEPGFFERTSKDGGRGARSARRPRSRAKIDGLDDRVGGRSRKSSRENQRELRPIEPHATQSALGVPVSGGHALSSSGPRAL